MRLSDADAIAEGNELLAETVRPARVRALRAAIDTREIVLDMRYVGQEHTLTISVPGDGAISAGADGIRDAFTADYDRTFGHVIDEEIEIVSLRATIRTELPRRAAEQQAAGGRSRRRRHGRGVVVHARRADAVRARRSRRRSASTGSQARRSCSRRRPRHTSMPSSTAVSAPAESSRCATRRESEMLGEPVVYRAGLGGEGRAADADPITTEVIRHGLNSAAEAMKRR